MDNADTISIICDALTREGYQAKVWRPRKAGRGVRIYVRQGRRELGYVEPADLQSQDCWNVHARRGHIRQILAAAQ